MLHDKLTPLRLLFKREELRSIPKSERGKEKDGSCVFASSPLYAEAVKKFYAQFTRNVKPLHQPI